LTLILNDTCDNFAAWTTAGSPTIAAALHGNGFSIPSGTASKLSYNLAGGHQTDTMTVGFNVRWSVLPAGVAATFIEWRSDTGATIHDELRVQNTGALRFFRSGTLLAQSADGIVAINTWYYIEASVKLSDTVGTVNIKVNGTSVASAGPVDTKNAGTKTVFDQFQIHGMGSTGVFLVDDVYIRNDAAFGVGVNAKAWNGSAFVDAPVKVWSGSAFVDAVAVKTWNGSAFV
jgi:hypothetical protein